MNYQQTLEYLFARLPMYSRIGAAAYKEDLGNITALCEFLDHPQKTFPSVHIAGTNGKGSTSHMLASVLQAAGYKVGLHTSPHVFDFRERIRVNGSLVEESFVVRFTADIKPSIESIDPSFFELSVAMAFQYFKEQQVDVAIIETGLGGRLDSTNIINPVLSVITNIGWDHTNLLGNTLELIAGEKAGIIKTGVPVVIGEALAETKQVFETRASQMQAPLIYASRQFEVMEWEQVQNHLQVQVAEKDKTDHLSLRLDLNGLYQLKNVVTVLSSLSVLESLGWQVRPAHIQEGLSNVKKSTGLYGRWEVLRQHPLLVLDVAHNADGLKQVLEQVEVTDHRNLHIVTGMVNDKDTDKLLALLPRTASYYFTQAKIPRAKDATVLQAEALRFDLKGNVYPDVNAAIRSALDHASPSDLVLVCGSIFLVAEVSRLTPTH